MQTLAELETKLNTEEASKEILLLCRNISNLRSDLYTFTCETRPSIKVFNEILKESANFDKGFKTYMAEMRNPEIQTNISSLQKRIKETIKECQDNCVCNSFFGLLSNPFKKSPTVILLEEDDLMEKLSIQYEIASQDINIKLCVSSILCILDSLRSKVRHFRIEDK
jgi:hypothetical protein